MVRIRGKIGEWPVDLTVEMEPHEWAQLAGRAETAVQDVAPTTPVAASAPATDDLWSTSLTLLRNAGQIDGPQLLGQLSALAGSEQAGKRLLVRMRHSPLVRVENGEDAPVYLWLGEA